MIKLRSLDFAVLFFYLVVLIGIGMIVSYRRRHEDDKFLAGRSFGWFNVGLSIFATNLGPSFLIASCSAAYATGMVTANFEWLAWVFLLLLAMVFAPRYLETGVSTMPEFIRRRFGERASEFLSWYALLSTVVLWLGGTLYAGGVLLSQIMGWELWPSLLLLMAVATSFTVAGGLAAVIVTDSFQAILMIVGAGTLAAIGFIEAGGAAGLSEGVPADHWKLLRPADDPTYPWPAIFLGYPILGIWFWCTDQTIVQRVLGSRNIDQGQKGCAFAAFLKILPPFIFMVPGIVCFVLHPGLDNPDEAFLTMVANHLPVGMSGLIVAVLIAALISTIDSGLNSFSTILTLDIYVKKFKPRATGKEIKRVGRVVTIGAAILAVGCAMAMQWAGKNMFDLLQSIIAYFAPPVAAVFIVGVLWRRATAAAAVATFYAGSAVSFGIGLMDYSKFPRENFWPHFMLMAFILFAAICLFMVGVSLLTRNAAWEEKLPRRGAAGGAPRRGARTVWILWGLLALLMVGLYVLFTVMAVNT